jgi:hypothetical protein
MRRRDRGASGINISPSDEFCATNHGQLSAAAPDISRSLRFLLLRFMIFGVNMSRSGAARVLLARYLRGIRARNTQSRPTPPPEQPSSGNKRLRSQ